MGIDGEGQPRAVLIDELLNAETEAYENRCSPQKVQKYSLIGTGVVILDLVSVFAIYLLVSRECVNSPMAMCKALPSLRLFNSRVVFARVPTAANYSVVPWHYWHLLLVTTCYYVLLLEGP